MSKTLFSSGLITQPTESAAREAAQRVSIARVISVGREVDATITSVEVSYLPTHPMNGIGGNQAYNYKVEVTAPADAFKTGVRNHRTGR